MSDIPRIIEINDICNESIAYVLETAGFDVKIPGDGAVWIEKEGSLPLKIMVNERDKMLVFQSSIGLNESSPISEKHKLADELNRAVMVRFYVFSDGVLVGDYYLSYEHGILTNNLILTCQLFLLIFTGVLRDKYEDDGVLDVS